MTKKITASEYRALRRRSDATTLARGGGERNFSCGDSQKKKQASAANYGRSRGHNKFGAIAVEIGGFRFPSQAEGRRYLQLLALQDAGAIRGLRLQPRFPFHIGDERMFTYVADFSYRVAETGEIVIEDVKGVKTPVYKLKKKIIEKYYGIKIVETKGGKG